MAFMQRRLRSLRLLDLSRIPGRVPTWGRMRAAWIAPLLFVLVVAGCAQQLMPTPNVYTGSERDCLDDVPATHRSHVVEIMYITDRAKEVDDDGNISFTIGRSPALTYGTVSVAIGDEVSWDDLVSDSRTQSRRHSLALTRQAIREQGHLPATPVPFVIVEGKVKDDPKAISEIRATRDAFCELVGKRVASSGGKREAYILVHGFANSFEDAAFVMAGLWHFLGRQGVPFIYTWPAGSGSYAYDRESGEFTIFHLKQFLRGLASCEEIDKIHIVSHSRGTDVVLTALRELYIEHSCEDAKGRAGLKLGNVVLAAADLDLEVVAQRIVAERIVLLPERLTIYTSEHDVALGAADILFKGKARLGELRPGDLTPRQRKNLSLIEEVQIVQCRVSKNLIGHDYFHSNPAVSSDLILLLRDNRAPGEANGRPLINHFKNFWEIRDGYPGELE